MHKIAIFKKFVINKVLILLTQFLLDKKISNIGFKKI